MSILEQIKQEKIELDEKISKLSAILDRIESDYSFRESISKFQRNCLIRQEMVMKEYSAILKYRIEDMLKDELAKE